jgi:hypothetical protein
LFIKKREREGNRAEAHEKPAQVTRQTQPDKKKKVFVKERRNLYMASQILDSGEK